MCGPIECLPCQPRFLTQLKNDRVVQVWTLLWIPLVVLWFIYFGFQIDNLATAVEDKSFQLMLRRQDTLQLPAWTICSDTGSNITQVQCQRDGGLIVVPFNHRDGCFSFNVSPPLLKSKGGEGSIDCVVGFNSPGQSARAFLHDPIYSGDANGAVTGNAVYNGFKNVPSGICVAAIQQGAKTSFWWRWNRFQFLDGTSENAYAQVSATVLQNYESPLYNHSGGFHMEAGDTFQWHYKEVQWWSGYDFWYFMGMVGGASFLLVLIHAAFFYPLKHLYGPRTDGDYEETAPVTRPLRDMSSSSGPGGSSSSSSPVYDTL